MLGGAWDQGWPEAIALRREAPLMPGAGVQIVGDRVGSEVSAALIRDRNGEFVERLPFCGVGALLCARVVGRARTARQRRPQRVAPKARLNQ